MKVVASVGLKTATKEEIADHITTYRRQGYHVNHKTLRKNGQPLPYNGVLQLSR
jgi:DNA polymerase IIIc chi subunit